MDLTKAGFAAGAINNEMTSTQAGKATADWVTNTMPVAMSFLVTVADGETLDRANASIAIGTIGMINLMNYFAATNQSGLNNMPVADFPEGTLDQAIHWNYASNGYGINIRW